MKNLLVWSLCFLAFGSAGFAQEILFLQPSISHIQLNPGFAGIQKDIQITGAVRHGLGEIQGGPSIAYLSYNQLSHRLRGGIGVELSYARWGYTTEPILRLTYAGKIPLGNRWTLSPGLKVAGNMFAFDRSVQFECPVGNYVSYGIRFSPGIVLNSPNFYVGVALSNLPYIALQEIDNDHPAHYPIMTYIQLGYNFQATEFRPWSLALSTFVNFRGPILDNQIQALFEYRNWLAGVGTRDLIDGLLYDTSKISPFVTLGHKSQRFKVMASFAPFRILGTVYSNTLELGATWYIPRQPPQETLTLAF